MSEEKEKKNYEPGKVKISSAEYRGLLEEIASLKRENEKISEQSNSYWRRAYDAEAKAKAMDAELTEVRTKLNRVVAFINTDAAILEKYKIYEYTVYMKNQQVEKETEETN